MLTCHSSAAAVACFFVVCLTPVTTLNVNLQASVGFGSEALDMVPLGVELQGGVQSGDNVLHEGKSGIVLVSTMIEDRLRGSFALARCERQAPRASEAAKRSAGVPQTELDVPDVVNADCVPRWIRKIIDNNLAFVRAHGHSYVLRTNMTLPAPRGMMESCRENIQCEANYHRQLANWEKFKLALDYLEQQNGKYKHVMFLDLDATFLNPGKNHDTARILAQQMGKQGASLAMADEDWSGKKGTGKTKVNGGMQMWANTDYAKTLLHGLLDAHFNTWADEKPKGWKCKGDDQMCLRGLGSNFKLINEQFLKTGVRTDKDILYLPGHKWNSHPCILASPEDVRRGHGDCLAKFPASMYQGTKNPDLEIVHFMGGAKSRILTTFGHDVVGWDA